MTKGSTICVEEPITGVLYLSYFYYIIIYFCASLKSMAMEEVFPCRSFFYIYFCASQKNAVVMSKNRKLLVSFL